MAADAPTGLLHLRTWLPEELDERFSTWCNVHHLEQLVVPGFRRVRRFELTASAAVEPARFLTVYDLDRLEVLQSADYDAYRQRSPGLPDFLQGHLRVARSDAWLVASVPAVEGMVTAGGALAHLFVPEGPELAGWFADTGVPLLDATGGSVARLLHAATGEQVVMVELDDLTDDLDPAVLPLPDITTDGDTDGDTAGDGADIGWGLYRLAFTATPDDEVPVAP